MKFKKKIKKNPRTTKQIFLGALQIIPKACASE